MPTKTWVAGEDFNAVDINSYLQNQMVLAFANASERGAEIQNPTVGMVSFLASTGGIEVFTDKTTPPSWRPPWNTAWGLVYSSRVLDLTLLTSPQWLLMHLPIQIPGRQYHIEFDVIMWPGNEGSYDIRFQTDVGLDFQAITTLYAGWNRRIQLHMSYPGALTNDHGVVGTAWFDAITAGLGWGRLRVFDAGPV